MDSGRCPLLGWHVSRPDSASEQTVRRSAPTTSSRAQLKSSTPASATPPYQKRPSHGGLSTRTQLTRITLPSIIYKLSDNIDNRQGHPSLKPTDLVQGTLDLLILKTLSYNRCRECGASTHGE